MIQLREPRRQKKTENETKINEKLETGGNSGDKFLKRDLSVIFRRVYWRRLQLWPLRRRGKVPEKCNK